MGSLNLLLSSRVAEHFAVVGRGLAGVGAGGEYPVCGTSSIEAADETSVVRKHRGFLVAMIGDCGEFCPLDLLDDNSLAVHPDFFNGADADESR